MVKALNAPCEGPQLVHPCKHSQLASQAAELTSSSAAISPSREEEGLFPSLSGLGSSAFSCLISAGSVRRVLHKQCQRGPQHARFSRLAVSGCEIEVGFAAAATRRCSHDPIWTLQRKRGSPPLQAQPSSVDAGAEQKYHSERVDEGHGLPGDQVVHRLCR